jgi:Domain of unknown function (DUF5668)
MTYPSPAPDTNRKPSHAGADTAGRIWGVIVLAVGVWFLLDVTFGVDMPRIPWGELWPLAIIFVGLSILVRGMRRSA